MASQSHKEIASPAFTMRQLGSTRNFNSKVTSTTILNKIYMDRHSIVLNSV